MMTDQELGTLYKVNQDLSHSAGLRGVFDAGYNLGFGLSSVTASTPLGSSIATDTQASSDVPPEVQL
jgi:hypothetical protein